MINEQLGRERAVDGNGLRDAFQIARANHSTLFGAGCDEHLDLGRGGRHSEGSGSGGAWCRDKTKKEKKSEQTPKAPAPRSPGSQSANS
jgi:hypothetical protein